MRTRLVTRLLHELDELLQHFLQPLLHYWLLSQLAIISFLDPLQLFLSLPDENWELLQNLLPIAVRLLHVAEPLDAHELVHAAVDGLALLE